MSDPVHATEVYEQLCEHLEACRLKFTRHDDDRMVRLGMRGEDLPMDLLLSVYENGVLMLVSRLPFAIPEDKRMEVAVGCVAVNDRLRHGSFDLNLSDGTLTFRMAMPYLDADLTRMQVEYMVIVPSSTIDEFNDKFLALSKGLLTIAQFIGEIGK